ncbi:hypothetical protein LIER_24526 [Lithospermum erythrorhizon]|uniref:Aminotransferase-like plant mobile domain-containing protein n=1 Tax=Lithospermum erythrorhizon TaxID=34254 RepID=A0AAV3R4N3_LITER
MVGCFTLLESWIYEYFPIFQHGMSPGWNQDSPRARRWPNISTTQKDDASTIAYRKQLDRLTPTDGLYNSTFIRLRFIFFSSKSTLIKNVCGVIDYYFNVQVRCTSYGPNPDNSVAYYNGCIRFMNFSEAYMPERVTRQFERVQRITGPVIMPDTYMLCPNMWGHMRRYMAIMMPCGHNRPHTPITLLSSVH